MQRLLIIGVDGPVGANLALALRERHEVVGVCRHTLVEIDGVHVLDQPVNGAADFAAACASVACDWIIHTAALGAGSWDLGWIAPLLCPKQEVELALHVARWAGEQGCPLSVVSSDAVFDGPWIFHDELSNAAAVGVWPEALRRIESAAQAAGALVMRAHAFGWSPVAELAGCAERMVQAMSDRRPLEAAGNRYATPLAATELAAILDRARQLNLRGLYHAAGSERISPRQLAAQIAGALELTLLPAPELSTAASTADNLAAPIAASETIAYQVGRETSLAARRLRVVASIAPPLVLQSVQQFAAQRQNGWSNNWRAVRRGRLQAA